MNATQKPGHVDGPITVSLAFHRVTMAIIGKESPSGMPSRERLMLVLTTGGLHTSKSP